VLLPLVHEILVPHVLLGQELVGGLRLEVRGWEVLHDWVLLAVLLRVEALRHELGDEIVHPLRRHVLLLLERILLLLLPLQLQLQLVQLLDFLLFQLRQMPDLAELIQPLHFKHLLGLLWIHWINVRGWALGLRPCALVLQVGGQWELLLVLG
jgi:hypothetical protein